LQQLQAETAAFRQQQQQQQQQHHHSSNISPRQPALCIIDDGRRDNPQLTYHSTKFWKWQTIWAFHNLYEIRKNRKER
jgi:hypothetical protein